MVAEAQHVLQELILLRYSEASRQLKQQSSLLDIPSALYSKADTVSVQHVYCLEDS